MSRNALSPFSHEELEKAVPAYDEHVLYALERRYLEFLDFKNLSLCDTGSDALDIDHSDVRMMRLTEITHSGESDIGLHLMHFQNILSSVRHPSHNMAFILRGEGQKVSLNYGVARRRDTEDSHISTYHYIEQLKKAMESNFLGTRLETLNGNELNELCCDLREKNGNGNIEVTALSGIPSLRSPGSESFVRGTGMIPYVQGLERFVEGMRGSSYTLLVIAEPVSVPQLDDMIARLFDLSTSIHSCVKSTISKMSGSSDSLNMNLFGSKGLNEGVNTSSSYGDGESTGFLSLGGVLAQGAQGLGSVLGSVLKNSIPMLGPMSILTGLGGGAATMLLGSSLGRSQQFTRAIANTLGNSLGFGGGFGYGRSWNRSVSVTRETLNKSAEYCEKLCDSYISRLQRGKNLGFWNVGIYLLTNGNEYLRLRASGLLSTCLAGDGTHWEPVRSVRLSPSVLGVLRRFENPRYELLCHGEEKEKLRTALSLAAFARKKGQAFVEKLIFDLKDNKELARDTLKQVRESCDPEVIDKAWKELKDAHFGHPMGELMGGTSTPMNTEELSIILNVPREEVLGVSVRETVPFGVNYPDVQEKDAVHLGYIVHKREARGDMPFSLRRDTLQKHTFVCGLTGSGKTNTCFSLLEGIGKPFLVIEPAKSEYRRLLRTSSPGELRIYTLGHEGIAPFRLNPFEFPYGGHLLGHIDKLKAVFNAAFPMYAAMSYILEKAILEVYTERGWNLFDSSHPQVSDRETFHDFLPRLSDLLRKIDEVVGSAGYAKEVDANYKAALKARISSLMQGSKGAMLDVSLSTPMEELLNNKTVLELRHVGDDDEKCFLMGLLLSQIYEYREVQGKTGSRLEHVLLIEEAHRLLRNVPEIGPAESSNTRGKAVETFSNFISEIRDYGEGIIIVDQIPSKMAQDVIKNTNVKIVHRTLAEDDRDLIGKSIALNEKQRDELPLLHVGRAVVHSDEADKPFLVQMEKRKDQDGERVTDDEIRMLMLPFRVPSREEDRTAPLPENFKKLILSLASKGSLDFEHACKREGSTPGKILLACLPSEEAARLSSLAGRIGEAASSAVEFFPEFLLMQQKIFGKNMNRLSVKALWRQARWMGLDIGSARLYMCWLRDAERVPDKEK